MMMTRVTNDPPEERRAIIPRMRIVAVILAAGSGRRMGGPKARLRIGSESFLSRAARLLARPGVDGVTAVVGRETLPASDEGAAAGVTIVQNPRPTEGMLSSILRGLDEAEAMGADAVLLHPVDHPLVDAPTVDRVVAALHAGALVAVPTYGARRGHPGGFARGAWPALRTAHPARGARAVLADHPEWVVHVPGDPGCVLGIDTPADYERWIVSVSP
jgi:CTP:molybdopterin cytidylyltransferase MocA